MREQAMKEEMNVLEQAYHERLFLGIERRNLWDIDEFKFLKFMVFLKVTW